MEAKKRQKHEKQCPREGNPFQSHIHQAIWDGEMIPKEDIM
jgi:hypothetical protein